MSLFATLIATTALASTGGLADDPPARMPPAVSDPVLSDPEQQRQTGVDDIVVTAQRREQNVQSVPIAISAVSGDRLLEGSVLTANDVSRLVPNLTGANGGGRVARPRYFLRGIGVNDPSGNVVSPVGVYYDDVYLGDTAYHAFPLFDLERVEVLRGPQGTLWGKNTIGGAINYISRRPRFDSDGYARLEGGQHGSWAAQGAAGGAVIDDLLAARISFNYEDREGYYRNLYTGDREGGVQDMAVRLQFLLTPTPDLDILLNVHARDLKDGGAPGYRIGTGPGGANSWGYVQTYGTNPRPRDPINTDAPSPPATLNSKGATLNIQYALGALSLTSITSYDEIERDNLSDGDGTPLPAQVARSYAASDQFTQELRLSSDPVAALSWTVGAHYFRENFSQDAGTATLAAVAARPGFAAIRTAYQNTALDQDTTSYAVFGEGTYRFTDSFRLALGGRWTKEDKSIRVDGVQGVTGSTVFNNTGLWWLRNSVSSPLSPNAFQNDDESWSRFTWSVTPQYDFAHNVRGYLRYATGFRSGGFNGNVTSQVAVNIVQPEKLTDYEAGIKSEWFDDRLTVNASAFIYDYKNIQVNVQGSLNGQSATTLRNAANGKISGLELEVTARPIPNLTIRANGGWLLKAEYSDFVTQVIVDNVPTQVDVSGNQIARAPKRTATLDFDYTIPLGNAQALSIGADVNYRSRILFNAVAQNDPLQEQAGYALVNGRISYRLGDGAWSIGAYVLNLTDKHYVHNNNVPRNGAYSLTLGPPRTWGATLTSRF